ncbi:MAG: dihydrodipicolinate synthase family protein [Acidobacteria bacterium]|nr:dihydrodipicolinate synthase family protein [Acidobacteriota bacterium]
MEALRGVIPALVTPFRPDERINFGAWQKIIDVLIANGVDGLFALGWEGEFYALEAEERTVALRFCLQYVAGRVPVYGNVGASTTRESVKLAQHAESEGVSFLVVTTPGPAQPTADELVDHYSEICRAVRTPTLACNLPELSGVDLTPGVAARVARSCENFAGIIDPGRDGRLAELIAIAREQPFAVFSSVEDGMLEGLEMGARGVVTGCANFAPRLFVELYQAFRAGQAEQAGRLASLAAECGGVLRLHTFPAVLKEAMGLAGLPAGPCRKPVASMPSEALHQLRAMLDKLKERNWLPPIIAAMKA